MNQNKTEHKKPLVLVDGSSYLYRAFHAMPNLTNSEGKPTGAAYGVINMIRKLLKDYEPDHIAVVFDARGKTFRDDMYADYKANRPPMPDELRDQIEWINDMVDAMGLPRLVVPGVEADDVIGTLAREAAERGEDVIISTGDKDLAQLVNDRVTLINTMSDTRSDRQQVISKFGVPPERMIDYLALVGDASDNVPGVPKVGPKTAAKWLNEYGSLDEIIKHADEIKGKVGENLRNSLDQLELSRRLVTIDTHLDLQVSPEDLKRRPPDTEKLRELYSKLEFKTWLSDLGGLSDKQQQAAGQATEAHYQIILDAKSLDSWLKRLEKAGEFAFDTETTSLNAMAAELVGLSFSVRAGEAAYVPVAHDYLGAPVQLAAADVLARIRPLLESGTIGKIGQNLKYDKEVLANYGVELNAIRYDTMLESYVLDSSGSRHDMDTLALKYLGYKTVHFDEVAGKGKKQVGFNQVDLEQAGPYAAEDADIALRLHQTLWPRLEQEPGLKKVFTDIEMPLVPVLARVERNGVKIDADMLRRQSRELEQRIAEIEKQAHELAGEPFNMSSPKQIQHILFEKMGLPVLKKTPRGQPSTAESALQDLALDYDLPRLILEQRALAKLKSTYTDKLPKMINPRTGRVHTSYHQAVAATGRLSSSDPNLQNIPVRTEEGRRIRKAFVAEDGCKLVAADYSQIELRIMAHLSQDAGLLKAFENGIDVHAATASEVFGVPLDQVTSDQRRHAKAINFGLIYGMSAFGLGQQLGIDRAAAQNYIDLYFARYPGVKRYMEQTRELARKQGYVETVFGRRLHLPEINSRNYQRRQYAERTAINAPMQGTAADLIKMAMIEADHWLTSSKTGARMIMQVHDELVLETPENSVDEVKGKISAIMTGVGKGHLSVPLEVEAAAGDNWEEAH